MVYETIDEWIREENGHQASRADQLITAYWFYRNDITAVKDRHRRTSAVEEDLGERLDHEVATVLQNLADIGVLDKVEPSTDTFILKERTNEGFFSPDDEEFPPALYEEISRLVYDLHLREGRAGDGGFPGPLQPPTTDPVGDGGQIPSDDEEGPSLRQFVAEWLDIPPVDVEEALIEDDDPVTSMELFDGLVEAIKASDVVERGVDYDQMGWRNRANQWSLSETATHIEENESLPI